MVEVTWLGEYQEDGVVYFRLGRRGDELIAEWPHIATLRADPKRKTSHFEAQPNADPALVDKVHKSLAQALLRHLEHKLTLHGAAVMDPATDRAIAIVGMSGSGKSTLAAALARRGDLAFGADDTLAIEMSERGHVMLAPTERESWLLPDACVALGVPPGEDKRAVAPPLVAPKPCRLVALVVPAFDDDSHEVTVTRVRGQALLEALVPCVVRFVIDDPRLQLRELDQLTRLSAEVPVFALSRPRDLARLADTAARVRSILDEEGA